MSEERESLQRTLDIARRTLSTLEEQAAGYTVLTIPAHLVNEIEAKRAEVTRLEARLAGGSADLLPNTLPQRDLFFGREDEIKKCLAALSPESRSWGAVVDGIGGIGKTALAVEVAYLCQERGLFDAFLFVSAKQTRLEPGGERAIPQAARTLDDLVSDLARALGETAVLQLPGAEKQRGLLSALRAFSGPQRRALLILDNLETLTPDEQMLVGEFLLRLPQGCKAIVTSRKRTGDGAVWLRLEKLGWEAARQLIAAEMERADNLKRALSAAGQARWQELYDATGGSPLALRWTLGLMRARNLSLDRALDTLRGATSDSPLHEFIYREARREMGADDWRVLGALSLFARPASFDALGTVTDLTRIALESALDRLAAYSLVDVLGPDGPYGLHPLTRRMTSDELSKQPELSHTLTGRFVHYWVDYATKYGGSDKDAYKTYDRLEAEWPNLDAAARALRELAGVPGPVKDKDAVKMLVDLARALCGLTGPLFFRGYWDESIELSEWAYEAAQATGEWQSAGWRAYQAAWIHYSRAETDRAQAWADRCAEAWERGGGRSDCAEATRLRGLVAGQRKELAEAERLLTEAMIVYRDLGEEVNQANVLNSLGGVARERKGHARAQEFYRQALVIAEKTGNREHQAAYSGNLGRVALDQNHPAKARRWYERELALAQEVGRQDLIAEAQSSLAEILEQENRPAEALALAEEALHIRERLRDQYLGGTRDLVERLRKKAGK
jgi:tetratricopeptide (TPR) repeat protein